MDVGVRGSTEGKTIGHVHLEDVVEHCDAFAENEVRMLWNSPGCCLPRLSKLCACLQAVLFMHFSQRYKASTIVAALKEKLPERLLRKVTAAVGDLGIKEEIEITPLW
jgi:hypothetical protein